jgi:hypothetical protein
VRHIVSRTGLSMALWVATPLAAMAALAEPVAPQAVVQTAAPASGERPQLYHLRCWQAGRLLFEETEIELSPNFAPYVVRLRGVDRRNGAVIVAETVNATCLIRGRSRAGAERGAVQ